MFASQCLGGIASFLAEAYATQAGIATCRTLNPERDQDIPDSTLLFSFYPGTW
jgi:hypothetical protein